MTAQIIFSPQSGVLSAGDKQTILTDQGKRCLTYFCLNEGVLISRETFTLECWGNRGIVVSDATVRQTVFRLRRSLSELGLSADILQTKGKSGYLLMPGVITLTELSDTTDELISTEKSVDTPESVQLIAAPAKKRSALSGFLTRQTGLFLLVMLLCAGAGYFYRLHGMITPITYNFSHQEGGRNYYASSLVNNNQAEEAITRATYWLVKEKIPVEESHYVYINAVYGAYTFVMSCTAPINNAESGCSSLTILGKIHS